MRHRTCRRARPQRYQLSRRPGRLGPITKKIISGAGLVRGLAGGAESPLIDVNDDAADVSDFSWRRAERERSGRNRVSFDCRHIGASPAHGNVAEAHLSEIVDAGWDIREKEVALFVGRDAHDHLALAE